MNEKHDWGNGTIAWQVHSLRAGAFALLLAVGLTGCHRPGVTHRDPAHCDFRLLWRRPPPMAHPPEIEVPPPPEPEVVELPPVEVKPVTPVRRRPPQAGTPAQPPAQPPVQVTSNPAPDAGTAAIGALSTGGNSAPQSQQEAKDLIASIVKRIAGLSTRKANTQRSQVRQVRHFLD